MKMNAMPFISNEKKEEYIRIFWNHERYGNTHAAPQCPIPMGDMGQILKCDCAPLRTIALSILPNDLHCAQERSCPVRVYLLPKE